MIAASVQQMLQQDTWAEQKHGQEGGEGEWHQHQNISQNAKKIVHLSGTYFLEEGDGIL